MVSHTSRIGRNASRPMPLWPRRGTYGCLGRQRLPQLGHRQSVVFAVGEERCRYSPLLPPTGTAPWPAPHGGPGHPGTGRPRGGAVRPRSRCGSTTGTGGIRTVGCSDRAGWQSPASRNRDGGRGTRPSRVPPGVRGRPTRRGLSPAAGSVAASGRVGCRRWSGYLMPSGRGRPAGFRGGGRSSGRACPSCSAPRTGTRTEQNNGHPARRPGVLGAARTCRISASRAGISPRRSATSRVGSCSWKSCWRSSGPPG